MEKNIIYTHRDLPIDKRNTQIYKQKIIKKKKIATDSFILNAHRTHQHHPQTHRKKNDKNK